MKYYVLFGKSQKRNEPLKLNEEFLPDFVERGWRRVDIGEQSNIPSIRLRYSGNFPKKRIFGRKFFHMEKSFLKTNIIHLSSVLENLLSRKL